jgi:hypothetical protein
MRLCMSSMSPLDDEMHELSKRSGDHELLLGAPGCMHARLGRGSEEEETLGRQLVSGRGSFICKVPSVQADNVS